MAVDRPAGVLVDTRVSPTGMCGMYKCICGSGLWLGFLPERLNQAAVRSGRGGDAEPAVGKHVCSPQWPLLGARTEERTG